MGLDLKALLARRPRRRLGDAERFARFREHVEPALAATPRVHRFAVPPVVGAGDGAAPRGLVELAGGAGAAPHALVEPAPGALEAALTASSSPWVVLADAALAPLAHERLAQAAALAPDARVITCDEDVADASGRRSSPRFFAGPSPDHLLESDGPLAALCVRREDALAALPEIPDGPARRWELLMRLAGPDGTGHAHVPVILAHRPAPAPPLPAEAAREAMARVLAAWGDGTARVNGAGRRVARPVAGEPLVEAIVLFRDKPELLERCVGSLLERTSWERLRVRLVDNGSSDPRVAGVLSRWDGDERVTVQRDDRPFNFAALNNAAVHASSADALVFLNNDTEVRTPDWLEGLLAHAQRPEVGAVAPLLRYPDGTVQHAGAALGLHGYAGHPFAGLDPSAGTPFGRADEGVRNWLAVTAACMLVERSKFEAVGGFDEGFVVAGNDVDLCLRLTARGHRSLCVPHVELLHDESRSRGAYVDPGDYAASEASYGAFRTVGDPFYNPNLTLSATTCQPRQPGEA